MGRVGYFYVVIIAEADLAIGETKNREKRIGWPPAQNPSLISLDRLEMGVPDLVNISFYAMVYGVPKDNVSLKHCIRES